MTVTARDTATFMLPRDLLDQPRDLVDSGKTGSQDRLVERAIKREILRARRLHLREEFAHAAGDPEFLRDMREMEAAFKSADSETTRMLEED